MAPGQGTENRLKNYLNHIKENGEYDICIIDCPPTPSVWMTSALIDTPSIIQEKSVYAIFDAAKTDSHFITQPGQTCVNLIHTDYATLCRTVHGDPNAMNPTSALSMLPQYNQVASIQPSIATRSILYICEND